MILSRFTRQTKNKLKPDSHGVISRAGNCAYEGCIKLVETHRDTKTGAFTIGYCREHAAAATYLFRPF